MENTVKNLKILPLGGCLLKIPLRSYNQTLYANTSRILGKAQYPTTYSFDESIQFIRMLRGEISASEEIRALAGFKTSFQPNPAVGDFRAMDVVLIEPSTPTDIVYGDYALNRVALRQCVTDPIQAANPGPEVAKLASRWLHKGLLGGDEVTQTQIAGELIKLMPKSLPAFETLCDVLLSARSRRHEAADGLRTLCSMIDRPIGVLTYTFRYMPDGRPVSWPAGFHDEVLSAAAGLGLPVFEPWKLTTELFEKHDVATVMRADLQHYADDFMPVVGRAIFDFAETVARGERAGNC
jgi:hypothetical protein